MILRLLAACLCCSLGAQSDDLANGMLLVADRDLSDPNFAKTVVLLVQYGDAGAVGLIVNRSTGIPLSRLFPKRKESKNGSDPIYAGGPVDRTAAFALLRSRTKPEEAQRIIGDVYLVIGKTLLEKVVSGGKESSVFRYYAGYCGWATEQLEQEVELGAWHIFPGRADVVFDPDAESLWERLIRKTETRIAKKRIGLFSFGIGSN